MLYREVEYSKTSPPGKPSQTNTILYHTLWSKDHTHHHITYTDINLHHHITYTDINLQCVKTPHACSNYFGILFIAENMNPNNFI